MLKLYHGASSVCSVKVRLGLAEKELEWESCLLNLAKSEQNDPEYLKLNPNGVVPTIVDGDLVVVESSVILEYIDGLSAVNTLMPKDRKPEMITRVWLTRCIDIHAAINTMTFSTVYRHRLLASKTEEEIEESIQKMANPATAAKRRDIIKNGLDSTNVGAAFFTLRRLFDDMQTALNDGPWMFGNDYSLADTAIAAYVDRLDRLGMPGLWKDRTPAVSVWLKATKARPSYALALDEYITAQDASDMRATGEQIWPAVSKRWDSFLNGGG